MLLDRRSFSTEEIAGAALLAQWAQLRMGGDQHQDDDCPSRYTVRQRKLAGQASPDLPHPRAQERSLSLWPTTT